MPDGIVEKRSGVERLKEASDYLRGDLAAELAAGGTQVSDDAYNLLKFHGSYEQFDRDTATARKQRGDEKEYSFMLRVRMPGGILTAGQYLALDDLADTYGNGTLRITTRQGIQFHGIIKSELKPTIAAINQTLLTTQAACGDVVRNVTTSPAPVRDAVHARLEADARTLSTALLPASRAYHQIFLDEAARGAPEEEPLYGSTYLPRKFKIGIAIPADNTIDVLTNDLGLIAIHGEDGGLRGYNVAVGGGLGMTHNRADTYPRLASILCSVGPDQLVAISEAVIRFQRDHGNRADRKRARLKYVLDDLGLDAARAGISAAFGAELAPPLPMSRLQLPELLGWHEQGDGLLWLGVPVASGRIANTDGVRLRTALREIVRRFGVDPIMTPQQDVLLSNVAPGSATRSTASSPIMACRLPPPSRRSAAGRSPARPCRPAAWRSPRPSACATPSSRVLRVCSARMASWRSASACALPAAPMAVRAATPAISASSGACPARMRSSWAATSRAPGCRSSCTSG